MDIFLLLSPPALLSFATRERREISHRDDKKEKKRGAVRRFALPPIPPSFCRIMQWRRRRGGVCVSFLLDLHVCQASLVRQIKWRQASEGGRKKWNWNLRDCPKQLVPQNGGEDKKNSRGTNKKNAKQPLCSSPDPFSLP